MTRNADARSLVNRLYPVVTPTPRSASALTAPQTTAYLASVGFTPAEAAAIVAHVPPMLDLAARLAEAPDYNGDCARCCHLGTYCTDCGGAA